MKAYGLLTLLFCLVLFGCRTTQPETIVVDRVKIDTLYISAHTRDSVHIHDSIYTLVKGDTVIIDRWHTLNKSLTKTDTIYRCRIDSIPYTVTVTKPVPYTPWYTKALAWIGICAIIALLSILIIRTKI